MYEVRGTMYDLEIARVARDCRTGGSGILEMMVR